MSLAPQSVEAPDLARMARRQRWRLALRSPTILAGAGMVLFWIACALLGPALVPHDPYATDILNALARPSAAHWFGTDQLGRDVFSRVIVGARDILVVAPLATALGLLGGVALGLVTGYFGGLVDAGLSRLIDAFLALPLVVVEMTVRLGFAIFFVASLSFLGFGIQPPSADWGLAISENYGLISGGVWWIVLFNALAIASLVVGVNLIADGVQEALAA